MRRIVFALVMLSAAVNASALNTADSTVIIPIIGRFTGVNLTQWQTDVFLGNPSETRPTVTLTFYSATGPRVATVTMSPFSTVTYRDIVLSTYGSASAAGPLEVTSTNGIEARARIYNVGNPAGQFGQGVPGIGKSRIGRQAYIYGLSGTNGNRLNVGVTNPNATAITVSLYIADRNGVGLAGEDGFTLEPHQNIQFNDIIARYGITPQDGLSIQFNTFELPIYGYASEVRNDTGDAIFVFGTSPNTGPS
jgi:hypothetical protein